MLRPNRTAGYQGYQPVIRALCTPDIISYHPSGDNLVGKIMLHKIT